MTKYFILKFYIISFNFLLSTHYSQFIKPLILAKIKSTKKSEIVIDLAKEKTN
jgi:hypothetical protein